MRVGRALAEAVRQLHDIPRRGRRVQVVAQPEVRVFERGGRDDVERATHRQHQLHVAERLERPTDARSRAPDALGDHPQLPESRRQHGEDTIGLAEVHRAQHDALGLVDARPRAHRLGQQNVLHSRIMIIMINDPPALPAP